MYLSSQKKLRREKSVGQITAPTIRAGLRTITDTYHLSPLISILDYFYLSTTSAGCGDLSDGVTQNLISEGYEPWTRCFPEARVADVSLYHYSCAKG